MILVEGNKMKNLGKYVAVAIGALTVFNGNAFAETEMNLAFSLSIDSHYGVGAKVFAEEMSKLSGGEFKIVPKPSGALGGERDVVEGLQIGSVDMTITSTGPVGNFVPEIYALDFPFLFKSYEHARKVLDGSIGEGLLAKFEDKGMIGLAWSENGFRHLTNSVRSVNEPKDMEGLKIRTMENKVHMAAFDAAGASPTPMSFTELFTALQQGTVDGQENPIPVITSAKLYEVQKHLTLTGHVYSPAVILISKIVWDGLSDEEKGWIKQSAKASAKATRDAVSKIEIDGIEFLRDKGMTVITDVDKSKFQTAVSPAYDLYAEEYGAELIEQIKNSK